MGISITSRLKHAWNAFFNKDPTPIHWDLGSSSSSRPDRFHLSRGNERSIVTAVYNRIAMDVAAISIKHVRLDENRRFLEELDSGLNSCLNLEANTDQTGRAFIQDVVISMMDEGCVAIVPVDTDDDPRSQCIGVGSLLKKAFQACFSLEVMEIPIFLPLISIKCFTIQLICNISVHHCCYSIYLLIRTLLIQFAIPISIFNSNTISHRKFHKIFIE